MKFEDFIKKGKVRKISEDNHLILSLIERAKKDIKLFGNIRLDDISSSKVMTNHFDILRTVLEAVSVKRGYKIYEHEAFTYLLKEIGEGQISIRFDRYRKIRNRVNYYGEEVPIEKAREFINDIKKIIDYLLDKYLGEFK